MKIENLPDDDWLTALQAPNVDVSMQRCLIRVIRQPMLQDPRYLTNHLLIFVTQGRMIARLDSRDVDLRTGDLLWIPPGVTRVFQVKESNPAFSDYRIHFDVTRDGVMLVPGPYPIVRHDAWEVQPVLQLLARAYSSPHRHQRELIRGLLLSLSCVVFDLEEAGSGLSAAQRLLVEDHLNAHIDEGLSAADLAHLLGLSRDHFSRLFRETYGSSPRTYLKRERIQVSAHRLLESNITVRELAFEMGYNDPNLFTRQFREVLGCTPTQYRQNAVSQG